MGSDLIIYGSAFRDTQGRSTVLMGGRQVPVLAWSDGAIHVLVNPLAFSPTVLSLDTDYTVQVVVPAAPTPSSNTAHLMITSDPLVTGFLGANFKSGDAIRVYGARFGDTQSTGTVSMTVVGLSPNGVPISQTMPVAVTAWSDNTIDGRLTLPTGASTGLYTLTVHRSDGTTGSNTFTIIAK